MFPIILAWVVASQCWNSIICNLEVCLMNLLNGRIISYLVDGVKLQKEGSVYKKTRCHPVWSLLYHPPASDFFMGSGGGKEQSPWGSVGWECHGEVTAFSGFRVWARKERGASPWGQEWLRWTQHLLGEVSGLSFTFSFHSKSFQDETPLTVRSLRQISQQTYAPP